jgi:uncharacterized membrane protein
LIILKFLLSTYIVGYYIIVSYENSEKLIFKIADIVATIILIAAITYSIMNLDIGILLGIITGFGISIKLILDDKAKNKNPTHKKEKK